MDDLRETGNADAGVKLGSKEKAALVVISLGAGRASEIYKYLGEQEIEDLTYAVASMGKADDKQIEATLDEFYKYCLTHKMMADGGMDYAKDVLERAFGASAAGNLLDKVSKGLKSQPFSFFAKADAKMLVPLIQGERAQVIALILSYMDPDQAAQVLEQLSEEKRIAALESIAAMDRVSPEAVAIVEEEMRRKFSAIKTSEGNKNLGGVDYVADMMNHVDRSNERKIFELLDRNNPDLAKSIRDKMFVFEDILDMDNRSVQRFVRDCDVKDVVYALKTATNEMKEVFFNNMSKRMAESVQEDLEVTTNIRLKEVEEAQQRIVMVIRRLEEEGEVIIRKGGSEDDIIV